MKSRPILFSTPMVKAILEGRKSMTRRLIKPQPIDNRLVDGNFYQGNYNGFVKADILHNWRESFVQRFAPWQVGDILWVRETYFNFQDYASFPIFQGISGKYVYRADGVSIGDHKWKPSIFMPREASRISLVVKDVWLEQLHDISAEDAIEEGVELKDGLWKDYFFGFTGFEDTYTISGEFGNNLHAEVCSFVSLWASINGLDSWTANPWVWVTEFEKEVSHEG